MALSGCNDDGSILTTPGGGDVIPPTDILPPTETIPPTDIIPPTTYIGTLKASGITITGDVQCNGEDLVDGTFQVMQGTPFTCNFGSVELGSFTADLPDTARSDIANDLVADEFLIEHGVNAAQILQAINKCEESDKICLVEIDAFDIDGVYQNRHDNAAVEEFLKSKEEKSTDEVGKAPSSHDDDKVVPEVSEGTSNNLNSGFVSADAESSHSYKPSEAGKVLTTSKLTDANGQPLVGVSFFSNNSVGVTDFEGNFEYLWGDTLTFGIDTFEFGKIKGNKVNYKLTDVTDNEVTKSNIQALLERYAVPSNGKLEITKDIQDTFAQYPNVINELINLSLPNGGLLEGSDFRLPSEFEAQFSNGLTADIDSQLKQPESFGSFMRQPQVLSMDSGRYVTESLQAIFRNVETFHVFNDNSSFYVICTSNTGHFVKRHFSFQS